MSVGCERLALVGFDMPVERPADGVRDAIDVKAEVREQFSAFAVLNEAVGDAEADNVASVQTGTIGRFENGAAKAAFEGSLFNRDDDVRFLDGPQDGSAIERLTKASVDDADVQPLRPQL